MIPDNIAIIGKVAYPCINEYETNIPASAPVGPMMLNLLPPSNAPSKPAQKAVIIPCVGVAPEVMASASAKGILTILTVIPDFQFWIILWIMLMF